MIVKKANNVNDYMYWLTNKLATKLSAKLIQLALKLVKALCSFAEDCISICGGRGSVSQPFKPNVLYIQLI